MGGASSGGASGSQSATGGVAKQPQSGMIGMNAGGQSMPGMAGAQAASMGGAMTAGGAMGEGGGAMAGTGPMGAQMMGAGSPMTAGQSGMSGAGPISGQVMGGAMMMPGGTMQGPGAMSGQTGGVPGGITAQTSMAMPMPMIGMRSLVGSPSMAPPGFEEPCKCEVECCQMPMEPRRPLPVLHLPMVFHYGCCGCVDCPPSLNPFIAFRLRYTMMMAQRMAAMRPGMTMPGGREPPDVISR